MRRHGYTSQRARPLKDRARPLSRPLRAPGAPGGGGRSLYVALFLASLVLFGFDQTNSRVLDGARGLVADLSLPVLEISSRAISAVRSVLRTTREYSDLAGEYQMLRAENRRLKAQRSQAIIVQARASAYEALLNYVPEEGAISITARTIADLTSPYSRSVIVKAGTSGGVAIGDAVLGATGLVGRVISTGRKTARVLLITDINSRIPVFVGAGRHRAILAGTNGPSLSLMYLPPSAILKAGDAVITSGEGRLLPEGLAIGGVRISPDGQYDVVIGQPPQEAEIVRIVKYSAQTDIDPGAAPLPVALQATPGPAIATTGGSVSEEVRTAVAKEPDTVQPAAAE